MEERLWRFTDNFGSFESTNAHQIKTLYFPLCNENIMSSITPDLHGDIKRDEYSFLLEPVSRIDLANSRSSRNFWVRGKGWFWSAAGVSKDLRQIQGDKFRLEAGLLWHKVTRENKKIGLRAEILSFAPASGEPVEIMQVTIANISRRKINFAPTAAIPIYARSAANIRDHRHVTSLLQRVTLHQFGVVVKPTLSFDEKGHRPNKTNYFVLGWDEKFRAPQYIYPTQEMFCGEGGDLEAPESVLGNLPPSKERIQGKEAMGGLRFAQIKLAPGKSYSYIILLGISDSNAQIKEIISKFKGLRKIESSLKETRNFWINKSNQLGLACSDPNFNHWLRWVSIQPLLRKIYGCSYLPDFDYGKGGRGWRDLWQDCLSLILSDPKGAAAMLVNNFSGVRMDGSNATIIGKKPGEFISDRNDIARVWMDHGAWPLITLDLYIRKTADLGILFEDAPYFRDQHIFRSSAIDKNWRSEQRHSYRGSILEHLLVQNLVQFYNVGKHNYVRLEGGDWNDGLDMAKERGESVAFSCMYAANLKLLAQLLRKAGRRKVEIARELQVLLQKINYNSVSAKRKALSKYFSLVQPRISGKKVLFDAAGLVEQLEAMSGWMSRHIRKTEWLKEGFFNGYYDNKGRRVEGRKNNILKMTLTAQVFAIMSGVAADEQIKIILKNTKKYLFDKKLKGYHLNTDFKSEEQALGRAFFFAYGEKENGAIFNHMVVMFAYALNKRGFKKEGREVLESIYRMAINSARSKTYPCLSEYFNAEGRGMYSYLTGSASWFLLALSEI